MESIKKLTAFFMGEVGYLEKQSNKNLNDKIANAGDQNYTEYVAGWQRGTEGRWWWQDANGTYPANQWRLINHHWYLFNPDGYMCTGWHRWSSDTKSCDPADGSGDWYFLDNAENGALEGACWHTRENGAQEIWHVE